MSDDYIDSYGQEERDLNLHIAKMLEHMEWENTLPDAEKNKRRFIKHIQQIPVAAETAAKHGLPWVLFGQLERVVCYAERVLGPDWIERARHNRKEFLGLDDDATEGGAK